MELTTLRQFVAVAETQSFSQGARRCHVTSPAVTKAVHKLEATLGVSLFHRTTRRVSLTPAGELFLESCRRILAEVGAAEAALEAFTGSVTGPLRIAANEVLSMTLLPDAIAAVVSQHPSVVPHCYEMVPGRYEPLLRTGRLDIACTIGSKAHPGLREIPLGRSPACLVCGRGHPLFPIGQIAAPDLLNYPSVIPAFFDMAHLPVLDQFPESRYPRRVGATIELLQMGVRLVCNGAYLGFFPRISVAEHLASGALRVLSGLAALPDFELTAVVRDDDHLRPATQVLVEALQQEIERALSSERDQ